MLISETTIEVLKNAAKISNHLVVPIGNVISSITIKRNRLMQAIVSEHFPVEFALHDLSGFLRQLSLFDEPDIEFLDDKMIITDQYKTKCEYYYSHKEDLVYLSQELNPQEEYANFELSSIALDKILRASSANATEDILFDCVDGIVNIKSLDKDNPKRVFSVGIGTSDKSFGVYITHNKKDRIILMPIDYKVTISKAKIMKFESEFSDVKITYYIACSVDSKLGGE